MAKNRDYTTIKVDGTDDSLQGDILFKFADFVTLSHDTSSIPFVITFSDLHSFSQHPDVLISSPNNNEVLTYETSTTKWKNKPSAAGGGVAKESHVSFIAVASEVTF